MTDRIKELNPDARTIKFNETPEMEHLMKFLERGYVCEFDIGEVTYIMDKNMKHEFTYEISDEALNYFVGVK